MDKAAALNSIILSNLLDPYPSLALAFASLYLDLSAEFGLYDIKFYLTNLPEQAELDLILSQVYVFAHELAHNRLKNKPSVYQNIINGFVNEYKLGELPICESENDKRFEDTFRTFEKVLKAKNTNIIEELTCDFVAALETMDIAMKTVVRFYNVDYAVNAVVNTVTKINYFQSWLRQLQMNWSIVYKNWKKYPQNIFSDHYMDGIPAPIYSETSVRVGLLVSMINEYFTKIYGCNDYARVVSTDIFDISSQHMFKYNFVSKILNMEDEYRRNLSAVEARSKRDFILKWK